jgi:hypothetical protein
MEVSTGRGATLFTNTEADAVRVGSATAMAVIVTMFGDGGTGGAV